MEGLAINFVQIVFLPVMKTQDKHDSNDGGDYTRRIENTTPIV